MWAPPVRFKNLNGGDGARRRPRAAVVAGGDPRRGKGIGRYLCVQRVLLRWWVVVAVAGEHYIDGGLCSGRRRLGWSWISSGRAAKVKSKLGLAHWLLEVATDVVWATGIASPE